MEQAKATLNISLSIAQRLRSHQDTAATLLNLGIVEQVSGRRQFNQSVAATQSETSLSGCQTGEIGNDTQKHYREALNYYQQSINQALSNTTKVQAHLNQFSLQIELGQAPSLASLKSLQTQLDALPASRSKIYAQVNFAKGLSCLQAKQPGAVTSNLPLQVLQTAVQQAEILQDLRAQSYTVGSLGQFYESQKDLSSAKQYTNTALNLAQQIQADDVAYQWQWQMGRLLKISDRSQALSYYKAALERLQTLRSDLIALNTDVQFSFRESVEPVYRQYVDLLLQSPNQPDLIQARNVIEALQLAELDNFFRDACSDAEPTLIDQLTNVQDSNAAVFYPIILGNRLDVILKLPRQSELQHYSVPQSAVTVQTVLADLRQKLTEPYTIQTVKQPAQQVYRWLIEPVEVALAKADVKTLVFVLDGSLRNIPMAALYDGERYLVEKYAIALTPGLQLLNPKPLKQVSVNALTGGLSVARQEFSALENVVTELETIGTIVPTKVKLINETFTESNIAKAIQSVPVSIVHLATHGRFSSQAENTFILAYDDRININKLETLLRSRNPQSKDEIELLVLSACETAAGDQRAALGLAGVAVRAGARSTLASLWKADDEVTARLISEFYRKLYQSGSNLNKAIALQEAQREVLSDPNSRHPRFWAPFVLLGNWL